MVKRIRSKGWAGLLSRNLQTASRIALGVGRQAARKIAKRAGAHALGRLASPRTKGDWIAGMAITATGARRYHLYRPPGVVSGERLPLLVMLHGCSQDAGSFAKSTRMNSVAARERFLVLYPEQDRLANGQRCWNWFETRSGRARAEAALILAAVDQICLSYQGDRERVAIAGLSAGASMAALVVLRHPERFKALAMHSGVAPGRASSSAGAISAMQGRRSLVARPIVAAGASSLPPLLVIQGALDRVVAPANARAAALAWVNAGAANGAHVKESPERRVQRGQRHAMRVVDFKRRGAMVASLVEIERLGHAWSGGAAGEPFSDAAGPDVSRLVWAFASKQFDAAATLAR
jgi:poly(hydroxyalkanoate) depolymerase family esterase